MAYVLICVSRSTKLWNNFPKPRYLLKKKKKDFKTFVVVEKKRERSEISLIFHIILQQLLSARIFYSLSSF